MSDFTYKIAQVNKALASFTQSEAEDVPDGVYSDFYESEVLDLIQDANILTKDILSRIENDYDYLNEIRETLLETKAALHRIRLSKRCKNVVRIQIACLRVLLNFHFLEPAKNVNLNSAFNTAVKCVQLCLSCDEEPNAMAVFRKFAINLLSETKKEAQLYILRSYLYETDNLPEDFIAVNEFGGKMKDVLCDLPSCGQYITYYAFNKGISNLKRKQYETCIAWMKECVFICDKEFDKNELMNICMKAQAHRYVGLAYLLMDKQKLWKDAIYASDAAENIQHHAENLCINLTAKIIGDYDRETITSIIDQIKPQLNGVPIIFLALLLQNLSSNKKYSDDYESIDSQIVLDDHDDSKAVLIVISLKYLIENGKFEEALKKLEVFCSMKAACQSDVYDLVEKQCKIFVESKNFASCVRWASAMIKDSNGGKIEYILCLRAYSLLMIDDRDAFENDWRKVCSNNEFKLFAHFLEIKRCLIDGELAMLNQIFESIAHLTSKSGVKEFWQLCLDELTKSDKPCLAVSVMENILIKCPRKLEENFLPYVMCYMKTKFMNRENDASPDIDAEKFIKILRSTISALEEEKPKMSKEKLEATVLFLMKISFNLALSCSPVSDKICLLVVCIDLLEMCDEGNQAARSWKKTCLMTNAAACLSEARENPKNVDFAIQAMECICQYKTLLKNLRNTALASDSIPMIVMYELEAMALLKSSSFNDAFKEALFEFTDNRKICCFMAAIANRYCHYTASIEALKCCMDKTDDKALDIELISKIYRSFASLVLCTTDECSDLIMYSEKVIDLIVARKDEYSQIEIYWMMSKLWNRGVHLVNLDGNYEDGKRLCSIAMQLLNQLNSLGDFCRKTMAEMYASFEEQPTHSNQQL